MVQVEALLESEASDSSAALALLQEKLRRAKRRLAEQSRAAQEYSDRCAELETTVTNLQAQQDSALSMGHTLGEQTTVWAAQPTHDVHAAHD